ncbi:MAG TPA: histidine kinase [Methylibium sp.]|nr:histidine kinase [Methylibium sp.]
MQLTRRAAVAARALARFLPTDPGYAPFGLRALRGLNVMPYALVAGVTLVWMLTNIAPAAVSGVYARSRLDELAGFVNALVCFTPMLVLVIAADNASAAWRTSLRIALLALAMLLGAAAHALLWQPIGCLLNWPDDWAEWHAFADCNLYSLSWSKGSTFVRGAGWGGLLVALLVLHKRDLETQRALHAAQLRRLAAEGQETEARLRSLQAQIEPHFLFNTLAHIQRLAQVQPERGRAMLRDLTDYLRSALPQMRQPESTLGRELAMARAYLNVQRIRMGERLRVEIDVPEALAGASLPPMMLVTLVENAIKHGIGPKREGGTVRVAARAAQGQLHIDVSDDGVGLRLGAGTGRGLANTRARLATQFGSAGALEIVTRGGGGVCARLALPYRPAEAT